MTDFSELTVKYERDSVVQKLASDRLFDLIKIKETEDVLDVGVSHSPEEVAEYD